MRECRPVRNSGLTIAEAAIVLVVLACLVALLLPARGIICYSSYRTACVGHAKAIAIVVRTYVASNLGWTPSDPNHYIKLSQFPLKGDPGWSMEMARRVDKFRCPSDPSPMLHPHGYPSSYFVTPLATATNVLQLPHAEKLPFVVEAGLHHLNPDNPKRELASNYVYLDMHGALGDPYPRPWPE